MPSRLHTTRAIFFVFYLLVWFLWHLCSESPGNNTHFPSPLIWVIEDLQAYLLAIKQKCKMSSYLKYIYKNYWPQIASVCAVALVNCVKLRNIFCFAFLQFNNWWIVDVTNKQNWWIILHTKNETFYVKNFLIRKKIIIYSSDYDLFKWLWIANRWFIKMVKIVIYKEDKKL